MVLAPRDPGRVRCGRLRAVGRQRPRPGAAAGRGPCPSVGRARDRRGVRTTPGRGSRRSRVLPDRAAVVPAGLRRPRARRVLAAPDRLLLTGVRDQRRTPAVLRRSRDPRRRPPQGGQRPRCADHRGRPALPARLLQAVAVPRGVAAGDLPGARPGRVADLPAPRARRQPRDHLAVAPGRTRPAGPDLGRERRPGAAADARHRRRGQPRALRRHHRPVVRRQQ